MREMTIVDEVLLCLKGHQKTNRECALDLAKGLEQAGYFADAEVVRKIAARLGHNIEDLERQMYPDYRQWG